MPTIQIQLTESESRNLRLMAQERGLRSPSGTLAGQGSIPQLIKALASDSTFRAVMPEEPPTAIPSLELGLYFGGGKAGWDRWWEGHYPQPADPIAEKVWRDLREQRWAQYEDRIALKRLIWRAEGLLDIGDLAYILSVLVRWYKLRKAFRKK